MRLYAFDFEVIPDEDTYLSLIKICKDWSRFGFIGSVLSKWDPDYRRRTLRFDLDSDAELFLRYMTEAYEARCFIGDYKVNLLERSW